MPRDFFGGLYRVPMWDYYWGLTSAQVELLTIDQPIVVYKAEKKKEKPWKDGYVEDNYASKQYQKWLEKKKKRDAEGKTFKFDNGIGNVRRLDMNEFLTKGNKKEIG